MERVSPPDLLMQAALNHTVIRGIEEAVCGYDSSAMIRRRKCDKESGERGARGRERGSGDGQLRCVPAHYGTLFEPPVARCVPFSFLLPPKRRKQHFCLKYSKRIRCCKSSTNSNRYKMMPSLPVPPTSKQVSFPFLFFSFVTETGSHEQMRGAVNRETGTSSMHMIIKERSLSSLLIGYAS